MVTGNKKEKQKHVLNQEKKGKSSDPISGCSLSKKCGGCQYQGMTYEKQCEKKQKMVEGLLGKFTRVEPMIRMENPYHYRNKVHAVFDRDKKGNPISGVYQMGTHRVISVERCLIEDERSDEIIGTIRGMLKSFKIRTYDEDTGYGLLRHVLIKRGFQSGQIMVVLVTASPVFPSKNNFVKALLQKHPKITTIVQNINNRGTSMVLGEKEHVLYGKGYIEDTLCECVFQISSKSFYQVNPIQTEKLYQKAMEFAELTGKETVIDAYCGIATIGLVAAKNAKEVIGIEFNPDAVRDARRNCRRNDVQNVQIYQGDAGDFLNKMAAEKVLVDVIFMDPPRSGSTEQFLDAVCAINPKKLVYISCNPETLERDLNYMKTKKWRVKKIVPVDMFPWTSHVETVTLLVRKP